jgi:hypothetical protein
MVTAAFPKVVRVEDELNIGGHYAVWVRMSEESDDVIHLDASETMTDEEAIAVAEYLRAASRKR